MIEEVVVGQDFEVVVSAEADDAFAIVAEPEIEIVTETVQGPPGPPGVSNVPGPAGPLGPQGPQGTAGNTVLYGTVDPLIGQGVNGDFWINTTTHFMFGPKAGGVWPAGASLVGPQGATGATGPVPEAPNDGVGYVRKSLGWSGVLQTLSASLAADVAFTTGSTFFNGPSIAQGTVGVWLVVATVSMKTTTTSAATPFMARLTDGTTIFASTGFIYSPVGAGSRCQGTLAAIVTNPANNLTIQGQVAAAITDGKMVANDTGMPTARETTISAVRIA